MPASSFLAASDLHGRVEGMESLLELVARRRPSLVVLLGDLFQYDRPGPGLNRGRSAEILARLDAPVALIAGNCDTGLDLSLLPWPSAERAWLHFGALFLALHGHQLTAAGDPPDGRRLNVLSGHTHVPRAESGPLGRRWNPGSLGLPRTGWPPTYGWYQDGRFSVTALDGSVIDSDVLD